MDTDPKKMLYKENTVQPGTETDIHNQVEWFAHETIDQELQEKLASSLTSVSTDIIPFLPYLLQDFWSLGSDPGEMATLMHTHTDFKSTDRALDLACGKGAVSIYLAKEFGCTVRGIDLLPAFIAEANDKATEHGVADLCSFVVGDVNKAVMTEENFDLTIWGAAGDLLGDYPKTLTGILGTVKPGGYILLDDAYLPEDSHSLRFDHNYLTKAQWSQLFLDHSLTVIACNEASQEVNPADYTQDLGNIRRRVAELIRQYPDQRALFEHYAKSQQAEYEDLQDGVIAALWLLQK